jgi:hypothetical protein
MTDVDWWQVSQRMAGLHCLFYMGLNVDVCQSADRRWIGAKYLNVWQVYTVQCHMKFTSCQLRHLLRIESDVWQHVSGCAFTHSGHVQSSRHPSRMSSQLTRCGIQKPCTVEIRFLAGEMYTKPSHSSVRIAAPVCTCTRFQQSRKSSQLTRCGRQRLCTCTRFQQSFSDAAEPSAHRHVECRVVQPVARVHVYALLDQLPQRTDDNTTTTFILSPITRPSFQRWCLGAP